jgi:hypothetical protein
MITIKNIQGKKTLKIFNSVTTTLKKNSKFPKKSAIENPNLRKKKKSRNE